MDITTIIVAIIGSGILNTILSYFITVRERKRNEDNGVQKALRIIMKDRLRTLCVHYIQQGWIYEDELEDLLAMHKCYHDNLKGNGYLDELIDRVRNLEIRGIGVN